MRPSVRHSVTLVFLCEYGSSDVVTLGYQDVGTYTSYCVVSWLLPFPFARNRYPIPPCPLESISPSCATDRDPSTAAPVASCSCPGCPFEWSERPCREARRGGRQS